MSASKAFTCRRPEGSSQEPAEPPRAIENINQATDNAACASYGAAGAGPRSRSHDRVTLSDRHAVPRSFPFKTGPIQELIAFIVARREKKGPASAASDCKPDVLDYKRGVPLSSTGDSASAHRQEGASSSAVALQRCKGYAMLHQHNMAAQMQTQHHLLGSTSNYFWEQQPSLLGGLGGSLADGFVSSSSGQRAFPAFHLDASVNRNGTFHAQGQSRVVPGLARSCAHLPLGRALNSLS